MTPSEAEPMKVLQSIADASAVATASRGDLRFMPFSDPLAVEARRAADAERALELRVLRRPLCAFVMMCSS